MYGGRYGLSAALGAILIGAGIIWACIQAMRHREGMYDQHSSQIMNISNILGILLDLGMMVWGIRVLHRYVDAWFF